MFAARLRLPSSASLPEREAIVDDLLRKLSLVRAADTVVGDVRRRGISGGERKRLSIGCELLGKPDVLFLDEPTSGLDAFQVRAHARRRRHAPPPHPHPHPPAPTPAPAPTYTPARAPAAAPPSTPASTPPSTPFSHPPSASPSAPPSALSSAPPPTPLHPPLPPRRRSAWWSACARSPARTA